MTIYFLEENDCYDWSDESEQSCPCASNENRCNSVPAPPGEWEAPGECAYILITTHIWTFENVFVLGAKLMKLKFCKFLGFPSEYWCDEEGIWDCPDGLDELNCDKITRNSFKNAKYVDKESKSA